MEGLSQLNPYRAHDFQNKTVPVYLLRGGAETKGLVYLLTLVLHNYVYRKWFRPYRSDIEWGQFVAKIMPVIDQPDTEDEDSAVELAMRMHDAINACLDNFPAHPLYITRPLFKAMAIVIPGQNYQTCGVISRVATISVLLMLTGEEKGLSAPISFDSLADRAEIITAGGKTDIRTNLETAIDFVMLLQEREDAAFGPQPDPVASTGAAEMEKWGLDIRVTADQPGWNDGPLVGPSSQWVDADNYSDWTGGGSRMDGVVTQVMEHNGWWGHSYRCSCHDSVVVEPRETGESPVKDDMTC